MVTIVNVLSNSLDDVFALITKVLCVVLATSNRVPTIELFSSLSPAGNSPLITSVVISEVSSSGSTILTVVLSSKLPSSVLFGTVHLG